MFKVIILAKKRPDISFEQFRDYYSYNHIVLMNSLLKHGAAVHRRNFVVHQNPSSPGDYDVVSEVFYEDRSIAEATMKELADLAIHRQRIEDEEKFLIPDSVRVLVVQPETTVFRPLDEAVLRP